MKAIAEWLYPTPQGLFCEPGGFYIDPIVPVNAAVITHAHTDHAKSGHQKILASPETIQIMQLRESMRAVTRWQALGCGQSLTVGAVRVCFLPAGHILGSVQVSIEFSGQKVIISGDFKRSPDPTCPPFAVSQADLFVTEATFALPIFTHPTIEEEIAKLFDSLQSDPVCHLIGVYPLGKAQRLIKALRLAGYDEPIYLHGALLALCELYERWGITLGPLRAARLLKKEQSLRKIVLCPPEALSARWTRRFGDLKKSFASGWMRIRARAKQKGVELPLIISDHADWPELTQTIQEVNPSVLWVTHGFEDALLYWARKHSYEAKALRIVGYEGEDEA